MLILENLSQLDKARERAMKKRPAVKVIIYGTYQVQGSSGNWYEVTCRKNEHGQKIVFCSCEDRYPRKVGDVCYHIPVAVGAHILLSLSLDSIIINGTVKLPKSGAPDSFLNYD